MLIISSLATHGRPIHVGQSRPKRRCPRSVHPLISDIILHSRERTRRAITGSRGVALIHLFWRGQKPFRLLGRAGCPAQLALKVQFAPIFLSDDRPCPPAASTFFPFALPSPFSGILGYPTAAVDHTVEPSDQITGHDVAIGFVKAFVPSVRVDFVDHLREPGGPIGVEQLIDIVAHRITAAVQDVDRQGFRNSCLPRWLAVSRNP